MAGLVPAIQSLLRKTCAGTSRARRRWSQFQGQAWRISRSRRRRSWSARARRRRPRDIPDRGIALPGRVARLGQHRIQAPDRRGLAQGARGQARPVLQSALPVARRRRTVAAAAAERLPHRPRQTAGIEFLYKCVGRGTRGLATLKPGDTLNMVGPLGVGFYARPGLEEHRRARPRRRPRHHGADLAARRRERRRRHRDPQRAQPRVRAGGRSVRARSAT